MAEMGDYQMALFNGQGDFVRVISTWRLDMPTPTDIPPGCFVKAITDSSLELLKSGQARMRSDGKLELKGV
jgi:hypothetical protein